MSVTTEIHTGNRRIIDFLLRVLTRDQLMDLVYAHDAAAFDRTINVRIGRLRKKLGDNPANPRFIKTVRNSGYIFVSRVTPA